MHLDYVVLPVEAVEAVRDWYRTTLEMTAAWESDDFVLLSNDDGAQLGFHRGEPLAQPGRVRLHFEVEDVDATVAALRAADVEFTGPADTDWGYRTASGRDPAGHTVELFTP